MGNTCDSIQSPEVINRCSGSIKETSGSFNGGVLNNFCTYSGVAGKSYRQQWCNKIGDNEWTYGWQGASCTYNDCSPFESQDTGCCGGCCGIAGNGVECKRKAFTGNPIKCCFNDFGGCGQSPDGGATSGISIDLCFSDTDGYGDTCNSTNCQNTCSPCVRNLTSNSSTVDSENIKCTDTDYYSGETCQDLVLDYCSGKDLYTPNNNDWVPEWIGRWMEPNGEAVRYGCLNAMARNIFNGSTTSQAQDCTRVQQYFNDIANITECTPESIAGVRRDGIRYASVLLSETLDTYKKAGFVIGTLPGFPGYNPFQEFIYGNICCRFPLVCANSLYDVCSAYDSDQLSRNPSVSNWCGCYLPDSEYEKYVDVYQVNKECTPLCNRNTSIPIVNANNEAVRCNQDICIIDDLSINLAQTNISGAVSISQMCGNCSGTTSGAATSCSCIFEDTNLTAVNSIIGSINFTEACTGKTCTIKDPYTGTYQEVNCDDVRQDPASVIAQIQQQLLDEKIDALYRRNIPILIVIGIAIAIIVIAFLLIRPREKRVFVAKKKLPEDKSLDKAYQNLGVAQEPDGSYLIGQNYINPTSESNFNAPF